MTVTDPGPLTTPASVEAIWRLESTRLIAALVRMVRDVGLAEDLAQDALVAALAQWPVDGVPRNPGGWLMTTAKRRAIDHFRGADRRQRLHAALAQDLAHPPAPTEIADAVDHLEDDVLRLMFLCAHPALTADAQATLTLKFVGGLSTREIARAYLTSEATIAQRVVRAKRVLARVRAALAEPDRAERVARLTVVLGVVYLLFNEGYSATSGADWTRPALCEEAVRLGRMLTGLVPGDAEAHGLLALMELQSSRLAARRGPHGRPVLLLNQDRTRWDTGHLSRGLAALDRAERLAAAGGGAAGNYTLQAAIAACHGRARTSADTDWVRIAVLYEDLARVTGSPVVEVNRAVALAMAYGPEAGLTLLDQLSDAPALRAYHLLPSVRGDLLSRLGRPAEARAEFERAAGLTANHAERELLLARAAEQGGLGPKSTSRDVAHALDDE